MPLASESSTAIVRLNSEHPDNLFTAGKLFQVSRPMHHKTSVHSQNWAHFLELAPNRPVHSYWLTQLDFT